VSAVAAKSPFGPKPELTPRELYRCQGFNDNYIINVELQGYLLEADRVARLAIGKKKRRKPRLTIEEQVRMCGNSVPPPMSMVLSAANLNMEQVMPFGVTRKAA
jgi:site-specific DNA-cytosine methylase